MLPVTRVSESSMRYLYSATLYLLLPAFLLRMLWRSRLDPDYRRRISERFGRCPLPTAEKPLIWLHAVSVGETLAAVPLVEEILLRFPDYRVLVTTTTPTGSAQVRARFGSARILAEEHRLYPLALQLLAAGNIRLDGRRVIGGTP